MKKSGRHLVIALIILLNNPFAKAQNPIDTALANALQARIDDIVSVYDIPGISVSILFPENKYWNGASGLSDIYTLSPMDTSFLFQMASVNKMYVAAMIFQMKEQGLLTLNDSVGMYLPAMANIPSSTTIANLLQHKSGIYEFAHSTSLFNEWVSYPDSIWPHLLTLQTFVTDPPSFSQGQFFEYSNTNYILLGMIIEQITGNSFASELRNRFCIPFGLTQTFFEPDDSVAGPQTPGWTSFTTTGVYDTDASLILNDCSASMFFTSGSIVAKPADVAKFTQLLWSGQIISDSSLNTMKQCTNVSFGQGCDGYGYGTMRYVFGGKTYYGHAGDVNGFTQLSIYQQTDSIAITISINRNNASRGLIAADLLSTITQFFLTSMNENESMNDVFIYPNPASDKINLQFNTKDNNAFNVSIVNQYGGVVYERMIDNLRSDNGYSIDVSGMSSGVYYLKLATEKLVVIRPILIASN